MPTIGFVSLGCPKALVDSEEIINRLQSEGYEIARTYEYAELVIVNTCGFIDDAVQESLDAIGEALSENGKVVVTGCLGVKKDSDGNNLIRSIHPSVLAITGPQEFNNLLDLVHQYLPIENSPFINLIPKSRVQLTPHHYSYLKISEGCNNRCTFCIIPSMRGRLRSRPVHEVLRSANSLFSNGTKELLIISQDTGAYGVDLKYRYGFWDGKPIKTRLTELASALAKMADKYNAWVRFHYVYPYPHVDELIPLMLKYESIVPYLDVPLQHADLGVLKRMRRPGNIDKMKQRIASWRKQCPDLAIRSTFIVGFPGETDQEFECLLNFIREMELNRVGCFAYSSVDGAEANKMPGMVPQDLRESRRDEFMLVAGKVSAQRLKKKIGKIIRVLIDKVTPDVIVARSTADSPDIDGVVYIRPDYRKKIKIGEFVDVLVNGSDDYDLHGELYMTDR